MRSSGTDNEVHRIQQLCLGSWKKPFWCFAWELMNGQNVERFVKSRVENNREIIQDPRFPFQNVFVLTFRWCFFVRQYYLYLFFLVKKKGNEFPKKQNKRLQVPPVWKVQASFGTLLGTFRAPWDLAPWRTDAEVNCEYNEVTVKKKFRGKRPSLWNGY